MRQGSGEGIAARCRGGWFASLAGRRSGRPVRSRFGPCARVADSVGWSFGRLGPDLSKRAVSSEVRKPPVSRGGDVAWWLRLWSSTEWSTPWAGS